MGAVPVLITVKNNTQGGVPITTRDLLYICEELTSTFLSRDALVNMGSVKSSFPRAGNTNQVSYGWVSGVQGTVADRGVEEKCITPKEFRGEVADCGCPLGVAPPEPPALPCEPTEENKGVMKQFLMDQYRASTFNTCVNQALPMMHGPPLEFYVKKDARPHAIYSPAMVPVHWKDQVKADI